jgi:transcriptional regulator with XRE-family HTH domain
MNFGEVIEDRRNFLQIKQEDLAELCGISIKSIQKIENNQANPTIKTLTKVLEVLGMKLKIEVKQLDHEGNGIL